MPISHSVADNRGVDNPPPPRVPRGAEFLRDAQAPGQIVSLAATGATDAEIADYLEISVSELCAAFARQLQRGRASMRIGLRKRQLQVATVDEGDVRLLQFLGKHYLDQSDVGTESKGVEPLKTYQNVRIEDV